MPRHLPVEIQIFCEKSRWRCMSSITQTDLIGRNGSNCRVRSRRMAWAVHHSVGDGSSAVSACSVENRLVLRKVLKAHRTAQSPPTSQELQQKLALSEEVIGTMPKSFVSVRKRWQPFFAAHRNWANPTPLRSSRTGCWLICCRL